MDGSVAPSDKPSCTPFNPLRRQKRSPNLNGRRQNTELVRRRRKWGSGGRGPPKRILLAAALELGLGLGAAGLGTSSFGVVSQALRAGAAAAADGDEHKVI